METKDLVLLMMIPIILIGLVVYTDKNPTITGAQTAQIAQAADNNILGTYSIMPSFRAKVDYNLNEEYKTVSEKLSQIVDDCKNAQDIGQCFKGYADKYSWNCVELRDEAVDILYDFIDKFNECLNFEQDGVVCRFSLDERSILSLPSTFDIILTNENQRTKVDVRRGTQAGIQSFSDYVNMENMVYTDNYDAKDTAGNNADTIKYIIDFEGKNPVVKQAVANINGIPVQLSRKFLFYKVNNKIKFIEATQEGNFRAGIPANKIIDVPRTKGFRFCAKSPSGKQFYTYDKSDNSVKLRDVVYKFSVTYPK